VDVYAIVLTKWRVCALHNHGFHGLLLHLYPSHLTCSGSSSLCLPFVKASFFFNTQLLLESSYFFYCGPTAVMSQTIPLEKELKSAVAAGFIMVVGMHKKKKKKNKSIR
jgi:hypothetical protein